MEQESSGTCPRRGPFPFAFARLAVLAVLAVLGFHLAGSPPAALGETVSKREKLERDVEERTRTLGPEHPMTMVTKMLLADTLMKIGDYPAARDLHVQIIESMERSPGPEHSSTLSMKSSLAKILMSMGDIQGSLDVNRQLLEAYERTLGPDHMLTLASRRSLGTSLAAAGEHAAAAATLSLAIEGQERTLGSDHTETQLSRSILAIVLTATGENAAAMELGASVVEGLERRLGPDHPQTLSAKLQLVATLRELGAFEEARELNAQLIDAYERTFGPENMLTLVAKGNMVSVLRETGDLAAALELGLRTLSTNERVLGPDSPVTLVSRISLAMVQADLGDFATARDSCALAVDGLGRMLGPDSQETLSAMNDLATVLQTLGDYPAARDMFVRVTEKSGQALGHDHPSTLASKHNLATVLRRLGDYRAAQEMMGQVIGARERKLTPGHPDTLSSKLSMCNILKDLGDLAAARDMCERVAGEYERNLGPAHPGTLNSRNSLASVMRDQRAYAAARDVLLDGLETANRVYGADDRLTAEFAASLGTVFRDLRDPGRAVFFFKLSVEAAQRTRGKLSSLERDLRRSYLATVGYRYRELFSILMSEGRETEALAVLGLLKDEELAGLDAASPSGPVPEAGDGRPEIRAASSGQAEQTGKAEQTGQAEQTASSGQADRTASSGQADQTGQAVLPGQTGQGRPASSVADLFGGTRDFDNRLAYAAYATLSQLLEAERSALEKKRANANLAASEKRRLDGLPKELESARKEFLDVCLNWTAPAGTPQDPAPGSWTASRLAARQAAISGMGRGPALLHAVSSDDALWLVLVTPDSVRARRTGTGRARLAALAEEFRDLVSAPDRDPREAGARLYDALVRPVEADLAALGTETLMLSLDGELRYAPVSALWDGKMWLAERYPTALFTDSTAARLGDAPYTGEASVRAMGVTAAWPGFPALPGVAAELAAVVRTPETPDGALAGESRLDAAFDRAALADGLASDAPVVHLASHFRLDPLSLENTVLLLGDGTRLSLREVSSGADLDFRGLDLLTLSACDTASGTRGGEGREVESLGEVVQRAGASAVLATLMPVDDRSAPELMREFYRLRYLEGKNKAEALRGAQLLVMRDTGTGPPPAVTGAAAAGPRPPEPGRQPQGRRPPEPGRPPQGRRPPEPGRPPQGRRPPEPGRQP
jgi:CHAT domain-containing protein